MKYHMLNYTHSDPLYEAIKGKVQVERCSPAEALKNVLDGKCDAASVSLISFLENRDSLRLLPTANIHTLSTTGSTLLISDGSRMSRNMDIAVTGATRTTSHYLSMILKSMKVNFKLRHSDSQDVDSLLSDHKYALVIGDEALRVYRSRRRILLDTGLEFSRLFRMAPVYAVTVASKEYVGSIGEELNTAMKGHAAFNGKCADAASRRFGISNRIMNWYYGLIRYSYDNPVKRTVDFMHKPA